MVNIWVVPRKMSLDQVMHSLVHDVSKKHTQWLASTSLPEP